VVGAFDEMPGDDLLVYARATCKAEPTDPSSRLLTIRLSDGHLSLDRPSPNSGESWAGSPIRFDVDGDGRHEAIVRDAGELVLLDPTRDWRRTRVAGVALPIVAASAATQGGQATRIAWLQADSSGANPGAIGTARVARTGTGLELDAGEEFDFDPADAHSAAATIALMETARGLQPPVGWFADVDTDGCPVLIVPLVIRTCGAADAVRPGASWIATRPLLTIGVGDRRRLLVAGGLAWGDGEMPAAPAPLAAAPVGWWRHGPSEAFALSELRAADLTYYREFPTPRATIERVAAADRTTIIPAFTGSRLFVASVPLGEDQADPDAVASPIDGLVTEPDDHVRRTVARVAVPPGLEAGRDGSVATIPLGDATLRDGTQVDRWAVTVVPINDWGEVGPPASGTVDRDLVGPSLALDVPMVTPVWPLPAKLTGASDPDTTVVVDGIGEVKLDRRGRFELVTQLAPWPQTLRLSAVDPSGNVTRREVSVVGGVDYRRFPWPIIAAVALLVLVAVSGVLGSRRIRPATAPDGPHRRRWVWPTVGLEATPARADADDGPVIEIEELPPGAGLPRT
jgi:hypothetical protein